VIVGTAFGIGLLSLVADTLAELLLAVSLVYALSGYVMPLFAARASKSAPVEPPADPVEPSVRPHARPPDSPPGDTRDP
jgi:hypothetical protein